jgi:hypothetical protein
MQKIRSDTREGHHGEEEVVEDHKLDRRLPSAQ